MEEYQKVLDKLEVDNMIAFIQEIIRINSVYDPEVEGANEEEVAKYIYDFLLEEGFEVYIEEVVPGRPNVIAFLRGEEEGKTLLFEGHTDVVSAGDIDKWTYDPFGGEIVEVDGKKEFMVEELVILNRI